MSIVVLCPSRGRPEAAAEAYQSFLATKRQPTTQMLIVIDRDDPKFGAYRNAPVGELWLPTVVPDYPRTRRGMVDPVNAVAATLWDTESIIGFVGDDHRFRTPGWDALIEENLELFGGGFAYGNDKNWRDGEIPTQIFVSSPILKALGWLALPTCDHLYVDNVWRVLGDEANCLYYFPDIVIEHMHPAFSKGVWDEQYRELNSAATYGHDHDAFVEWMRSGARDDINRVRGAIRP